MIKWTDTGVEYKAGPRQVERLLEGLQLDGEGVNGAVTFRVKVPAHQFQNEKPLPPEQDSKFRAVAARANFLVADRQDGVMLAAKEICRFIAKPIDVSLNTLKRLGTYLKARLRLVFTYA